MASTYSTLLRIELIATGDQSGTWGTTTDTNLGTLIEKSIAGTAAVTHPDTANYTMTANNGADDEARCMMIKVTGVLSIARNVVCPTSSKMYIVHNATSGGFSFTFKTSGGTGVVIANGAKTLLYCDGTNVLEIISTGGYQPLDSTLTALAAYNTNGLLIQTTTDTFVGRTITGTASQITATNGDGVAGNPTLSLPADVLIPTVLTVPNAGLHILDTNATHDLIISPGSNITADRTFTLTTGDNDRTLDISGASVTISAFGATLVDDANAAAARTTLAVSSTSEAAALFEPLGAYSAVNDQTGTTYTFVLTDASKLVSGSNASAITWTVPANSSVAYPTRSRIDIWQKGAGQITIAAAGGVTIHSFQSSLKLNGQYAAGSLIKLGTDEWLLIGNLDT